MARRALIALLLFSSASFGSACKAEAPTKLTIAVEGMTCNSCVRAITAALRQLPGVQGAEVKLKAGRASVTYLPSQVSKEILLKTITKLGYKARALAPGADHAPPRKKTR